MKFTRRFGRRKRPVPSLSSRVADDLRFITVGTPIAHDGLRQSSAAAGAARRLLGVFAHRRHPIAGAAASPASQVPASPPAARAHARHSRTHAHSPDAHLSLQLHAPERRVVRAVCTVCGCRRSLRRRSLLRTSRLRHPPQPRRTKLSTPHSAPRLPGLGLGLGLRAQPAGHQDLCRTMSTTTSGLVLSPLVQ